VTAAQSDFGQRWFKGSPTQQNTKGAEMSELPNRADEASGVDKRELFELLIESATGFAIFTMDPSGLVTSWNSGARRLLGFDETEIIGQTADVIFTAEDQAAAIPDWERSEAAAHGKALDERWTLHRDGSRFWASGLMMPLADRNRGFVKIFRDLTEQHRAEARLRENEERFRLLATNIPQLVFRTQPDGMRTWGSPQWINFTGLNLEQSLRLGWLDAVHPDDRDATQAAWEVARREGEYYIEHRLRHAADGEYRWHQTRARPVAGDVPSESLDWVGTMTDVHDLRGLKDRQQVLLAELQHRTRNLLAVVQSIASQTIRKSESLSTFQTVFESRLRALSRVQALLARVDDQDIDLHSLVTAELAAHGGASEKVFVRGPAVGLPPTSAQALALALHELLTNAVKYGALSQAAGRLTVSWDLESVGGEKRVSLLWRETGVAMPAGGPTRRGYGMELIERALPYQLQAKTELEFRPEGVYCSIEAPVRGSETRHD
jgi:PAS domain S-box-containing protein